MFILFFLIGLGDPKDSFFKVDNVDSCFRVYRMDDITGQWVRYNKEPESWGAPTVSVPQQHNFKQEPIPSWPPIPVQSQIYY